jgi:hypothetical protein
MVRGTRVGLACLAALGLMAARPAAVPQPDGVAQLLTRLERVLASGRSDAYLELLSPLADRSKAAAFAGTAVMPGATRAVVRERDRLQLDGTLPGEGYELSVDVMIEAGRQARLSTWRLDVKRMSRRAPDADDSGWRIANQKVVGTLPALHSLALDAGKQYHARDLVVSAEDVRVTVPDGCVFVAEAAGQPTAAVILGRGQVWFSPSPATERGQVRIYAGAEPLETPVDAVMVRFAPSEFARRITGTLEPRAADPRALQKAEEVFRADAGRSFGVDLGDMSAESWSLLPTPGDFVAEIHTRRFGTLTYVRSPSEVEDISLFDRARHRNIAVYESADHLATRGRFYNEDDDAAYRVESYGIDASFDPARRWIEGQTRLRIQVKAPSISTLTLRLAESLVVRSVVSREYGRLLSFRIRNQDSIVVSLPSTVVRGQVFTLDVAYDGIANPQAIDQESIQQENLQEVTEVRLEESYLYSNRSYWYAQAPATAYSTATLRVSVPRAYSCVASGHLVETVPAGVLGPKSTQPARRFTFVARQPARYFACLISPLVQAASKVLRLSGPPAASADSRAAGAPGASMTVDVQANPRLQGQARWLADTAADVLQYYGSIMGDTPYSDATVAAVEWKLPGGHSPAYMAVLNQPLPGASTVPYRNDPAFFDNYPEFFIAHELAHQWWGQAVGGKNYHEQWLSEGMSQYFAALYAGHRRGPDAFDTVVRRFRQWALDKSDQGPIYLGYRVGHIKGDSRVFRAIVYNKSAAVLHMMRRLVGDDAFFRGLRRFYATWRFQKAGSDDLRAAMEAESGTSLARFFDEWVYGDEIPTVTYWTRVEDTARGPEALVHFEQTGKVFDLPVTVTLDYADQAAVEAVARVTDRVVEFRLPVSGSLRRIEVNRDSAALAAFKPI